MRIFFRLVGLLLVLLLGVLLWNTYRLPSRQLTDVAPAPEIPVSDSAVLHLSRAIQIPTISDSAQKDTSQFEAFVQFLENSYPRVHQHLERERINRYALLYQWKGSNPDLKPILLMGHYDVVPVIEGTESSWTKAPFSGAMQDGYLYGRGSLDDKSTVLGILESVEYLLGQDFQPERTVYLSFGHDEEVSGLLGGKALAQMLEKRDVKLEMVLDEGGTIKTDGVAGLNQPVALVGIAEKGYTSVQLTAHGEGGHSSMPPAKTSIGMLATAIDNLQKSPFATNLGGTVGEMLRFLGPEMPFMQKLAIANLWLFEPLLISTFSATNSGAASTHTTIAPTILKAGVKDNVLPIDAQAVINFRILPGDSVQGVVNHVKAAIKDTNITVESLSAFDSEPSAVSPPDADAFQQLHRAIKACYPDVLVSPYLVLGATDARYYRRLSENIYRFTPYQLDEEDLKRPHGTNERIRIATYHKMIQFYATLLSSMAK